MVGIICNTEFPYANAKVQRHGSAPLSIQRVLWQITELKQECDFIIVVLHVDEEIVDYPAPFRIGLSRMLVDNGVDAVI